MNPIHRLMLMVSVAITPNLPAFADSIVENEALARQDWMLQCQGCHGADARGGNRNKIPNMAGMLARFLTVEGGREYLTEVPGVVTAPLSARRLANVMNWMMLEFDGENLPDDFKPFTEEEMRLVKAGPMVTEIMETRERLIKEINAKLAN